METGSGTGIEGRPDRVLFQEHVEKGPLMNKPFVKARHRVVVSCKLVVKF
jgi:hypothetical protein